MAVHRLLEALNQYDAREMEQIFSDESVFDPMRVTEPLAPIKRVAIFAEAFLPKVDGVSKTAVLTLRYLQQTGREVLVFAPDTAPSSIHGARVVPLPSVGLPVAPETRMALPHPLVSQHLSEFKADLIHLFSPAVLSVSGMIAGRQAGIPVIANYQTDLPGYAHQYGYSFLSQITRDWLRYIHNGCHLTLAPSRWTLRELRHWGYKRLQLWGRGVNSAHFRPQRRSAVMRQRLLNGRDPDSLLCIYVGRLANEKRLDLLLEVARTPGVALTIIGDGALRGQLEEMFAGTDTHFTGYLFGSDLADAYASADVFLFTGPNETFGQVVQEALASGIPAIVINQGGVTDLVQEGVNGFICPANQQAFASAVRLLRDDPALREQMAINARRMAERHPWEAVMNQLEGYYRTAASMNARFNRLYPPAPRWLPILLQRRAPAFEADRSSHDLYA